MGSVVSYDSNLDQLSHKMDLDFEESLPSYSNLVAPSRSGTGGYDSQERQSGHVSV